VSVLVLTLLLAAVMLFMGPVQDTGDDAILAWQLSRGGGSFAAFLSPWLSAVFSYVYRIAPSVPWWPAFLFSGGVTVLGVLLSLAPDRWEERVPAMFFSFAGVWLVFIKTLNFTRTASAFALAGILLVLRGMQTQKTPLYVRGALFWLLGCWVRPNAAELLLPFFLLMLLQLLRRDGRGARKCVRLPRYWAGAAALAAVILLSSLSTVLYESLHPDYRSYAAMSTARARIVDYVQEYPSWEEGKDAYLAAGLTDEADWQLLTESAFISDSSVFSLETLQNIAALRHSGPSAAERFVLALKRNYWSVLDSRLTPLAAFTAVLIVCFFGAAALPPLLLSLGGAGVMLLWVAFRGRMMLRVWEPAVFAALVCAVFLCGVSGRPEKPRRWFTPAAAAAALAVFFLCGLPAAGLRLPSRSWDRDQQLLDHANSIRADSGSLYLLSWGLINNPPTPAPFGLWETPRMPDNYFALCNWDCNHPAQLNKLAQAGIDNPVTALWERSDVKSDFDSRLSRYLNVHYGPVSTTAVGAFDDGLPIVQYTKPLPLSSALSTGALCGTLERARTVEHSGASWLRLEGTLSALPTDTCACYGVLSLDGQSVTCRLQPDENGRFTSDLLLSGADTDVGAAAASFTFAVRDASGTLWRTAD